jgi:hypothetical protein
LPEQITTEQSFEERVKGVVYDTLKDVLALPEELRSWIPYWVEQYGIAVPRNQIIGAYTTADTVSELGEEAHGRICMIRAGATPYDFIQVTYDQNYGKWVSSPTTICTQINPGAGETTTSATYVDSTTTSPSTLPWQTFSDAGLTMQFRLMAVMLVSSGAQTGALTIQFTPFSSGGAAGTPVNSAENEITTQSTSAIIKDSGWQTITGVTVDDILLAEVVKKCSGGATLTFAGATIQMRFVSA